MGEMVDCMRDLADARKAHRAEVSATDRCARADRGKRETRRLWKKQARAQAKQALLKELRDAFC